MPNQEQGRGGRFGFLEAGRGFASLAVVSFHSLTAIPQDALPGFLQAVRTVTEWGWLGVHVFFAISGWCIAERLAKGLRNSEGMIHFAAERFLRIYPTYWAALALAILLRLGALPFNRTPLLEALPAGGAGWLASLTLFGPPFGGSLYLLVSWSLVYELAFYLCAAWALWALGRRRGDAGLFFAVGALACAAPLLADTRHGALSFLGMWPEFFAGAAAWWAARKGHWVAGGAAVALITAVTLLRPDETEPGHLTALITALVLAGAWRWDSKIAATRVVRPFASVGALSYSLYLIHVPLCSPFNNLLGRWIPTRSGAFVAVWACSLLLALAGAWALNRAVEAPVERWRRSSI